MLNLAANFYSRCLAVRFILPAFFDFLWPSLPDDGPFADVAIGGRGA